MNLVLHYILLTLIFSQGILQLLNIPLVYISAIIIPAIVIILLLERIKYVQKIKLPYFGFFFFFIIISIISKVLNNIHILQYIVFVSQYWWAYLYFLVIINETNLRRANKIFKAIKIFILVQLPAVFIKFLLLGISEKGGIGTLSISSGSLSVIFAILIIVVLFSLYFYKRKKKYLLLIMGFILFAIIGEKRSIILFGPLLFVTVFLIYLWKSKKINPGLLFKYLSIIVFGAGMSLYISLRLIPSLNPDNKVWGQFDPAYVVDWFIYYTKIERDRSRLDNIKFSNLQEIRRVEGLYYFPRYLYRKGGASFYLGEGAGNLIMLKSVTGIDSSMLAVYGVRYGGRMGIIMTYLQIGLLGVLIYFGMYIKIFIKMWKKYKHNPESLALLSVTVLFFLDSIFYSNSFMTDEVLLGIYFTLLGGIYLQKKWGNALKII
jgi:hypothetical protein